MYSYINEFVYFSFDHAEATFGIRTVLLSSDLKKYAIDQAINSCHLLMLVGVTRINLGRLRVLDIAFAERCLLDIERFLLKSSAQIIFLHSEESELSGFKIVQILGKIPKYKYDDSCAIVSFKELVLMPDMILGAFKSTVGLLVIFWKSLRDLENDSNSIIRQSLQETARDNLEKKLVFLVQQENELNQKLANDFSTCVTVETIVDTTIDYNSLEEKSKKEIYDKAIRVIDAKKFTRDYQNKLKGKSLLKLCKMEISRKRKLVE